MSDKGVQLGLGLGISLGVVSLICLSILWGEYYRRKHPAIPNAVNSVGQTKNWLTIWEATRPRSITEKICSVFSAMKGKPEVQEIYVMENGQRVPK